jgi:hypothetical protein
MDIIQKLFQKCGGATPIETLPVRAIRTLPPDHTERYIGRHFPAVSHLTGIRKHASKRCVVCIEKKERNDSIQLQ